MFRADPDVALAGYEEPILLDEWQEVPTVLGAVKWAVDRDARPGRFLLTGSVRADSAGIVSDSTLLRAAGINRRTAIAYEQLLTNLFVVEAMPAWVSNRLRRLSRSPKRYFLDPAVVAATLRLDAGAVLRDGDLLGRLLDTFVVAQLRAEGTSSEARPRLYHLREEHGRYEVDVLAEIGGREVLAFEVKADAAPGRDSARHLARLRDSLGERFLHGVVFHTGPAAFELEERVSALPICALWG